MFNNDRDIAKSVLIKTSEFNQQVIINGVAQNIPYSLCSLNCPVCNTILFQFKQGMSRLDVLKLLNSNNNEVNKFKESISYCPHCGQKLDYVFDVVDGITEDKFSEDMFSEDNQNIHTDKMN